ncbi:lysophospholipid acyltransferase family protein [Actinomadura mexicana]|uniref:1-acyl-sn-glycerol-3-phosphate acyltransferases n=1 Tax=Actinomadura mexicana TaxID=134959 RepID=A0A238YZ35_9ACTN|nr:lysophospholipid acyltransferase family protein [Actinomadura mexicana]SNR76496.1 1-acyl-sn-glycerol-3-phosphate acyltransferases [Actinomadura mexicana]
MSGAKQGGAPSQEGPPGHRYSPGWRMLTIAILRPLLFGLLGRDWRGRGNVPKKGGVIIAANHISESDPLALAHFVYESGRYPVYLAKSTLFDVRFFGAVLRGTGQIPVYRDSADAALALRDAEKALLAGECLMFYPEGSCTRDPELWPMTGQTGAARMALKTGAKVVPVASWGAHELMPYRKGEQKGLAGSLKKGVHPLPRKKMKVIAGPPVDLSRYAGLPLDRETLRAATDDIMAAITALLGELRGEEPPAVPFDHHKVLEERRRAAEADAAGATADAVAGLAADAVADGVADAAGGAVPEQAGPAGPESAGWRAAEPKAADS